jgi:hypothetical protein
MNFIVLKQSNGGWAHINVRHIVTVLPQGNSLQVYLASTLLPCITLDNRDGTTLARITEALNGLTADNAPTR